MFKKFFKSIKIFFCTYFDYIKKNLISILVLVPFILGILGMSLSLINCNSGDNIAYADDADDLADVYDYGYFNGYLVFKSGDGSSLDTFEFLTNSNTYRLDYFNFVIPYNYDVFYRALSQPFYIEDLESGPFSYRIELINTAIGFVGGSVQLDAYIQFIGSDNVIYDFEYHEVAGFSSERPNFTFGDIGQSFYDYVTTELTLPDFNMYVTQFEVLMSRPYGSSIDTRLEYDVNTYIQCLPLLPYNEYVINAQSFIDNIGSYSTLQPISNTLVGFVGNLLNIQLFPNFSLLNLLTIVLCVPLVILICKLWLGG